MIEAYFDSQMGRKALITGAYQYDTGQRLRLSGLPSPDELAEMDDFLSGDVVTVTVHYSRTGDAQADSRLATYDDERGVWLASIPDEYLSRHVSVHVQVYVYYGNTEEQDRGKTMYEGTFVPISRSAPNNMVSDDQLKQWETLEQEVELALAPVEAALEKIQASVEVADAAAAEADQAVVRAQGAEQNAEDALAGLLASGRLIAGLKINTTQLSAGSAATATKSGNTITLGIPRGAKGQQGESGSTGFSDLSLSMSNGVLTITPR